MKTRNFLFAALALMLLPLGTSAQNTETILAEIRKQYSDAMEALKIKTDPEYPAKDRTIMDIDEMWPGSGLHKGKVELYYGLDLGEDSQLHRFPRFARFSYNIGGLDYYYEILYQDPENGKPEECKPIFYYTKLKDYSGNNLECRYYWWNSKLVKTLCPTQSDYLPSAADAYKRAQAFISYIKIIEDITE